MVDVDHFKHVNDTYGHPAGDVVLQQVAKRLVSTFPRKTDFARYGGEEFCGLLQGADGELSQRLGERLLDALRGEGFSYQGVLNNKDFQGKICPGLGYSSKAPGRFKKVRPARPQPFLRAERKLST